MVCPRPLLFIDLADLQLGFKMVVYVDNILLTDQQKLANYNQIQEDVTSIEQWMTDNFLTLNATKCKHVNNKEKTHAPTTQPG